MHGTLNVILRHSHSAPGEGLLTQLTRHRQMSNPLKTPASTRTPLPMPLSGSIHYSSQQSQHFVHTSISALGDCFATLDSFRERPSLLTFVSRDPDTGLEHGWCSREGRIKKSTNEPFSLLDCAPPMVPSQPPPSFFYISILWKANTQFQWLDTALGNS